MTTAFRIGLLVHVAAASLALLTLAVPLVTKKGGRLHRRVGLVYAWAMGAASATALLLSAGRLLVDSAGTRPRALFLGYVSLLTTALLTLGLRALRPAAKRRTAPSRDPLDVGMPALLLVTSVGMTLYGALTRNTLLVAFPPVGAVIALRHLRYWLTEPREPKHWWMQHMGGMIGSAIGALTAFVVINAPRLGASFGSPWVWLAPTALGVPGLLLWQAAYRRRFSRELAVVSKTDTSSGS